jgi:hypothetical protein
MAVSMVTTISAFPPDTELRVETSLNINITRSTGCQYEHHVNRHAHTSRMLQIHLLLPQY